WRTPRWRRGADHPEQPRRGAGGSSFQHTCVVLMYFSGDTRMIIGVPKEVKDHETRVGLVPSGVTALREAGHDVLIQSTAGEGSSITDREYMQAGGAIVEHAEEVWRRNDLVVK